MLWLESVSFSASHIREIHFIPIINLFFVLLSAILKTWSVGGLWVGKMSIFEHNLLKEKALVLF